MSAQVIAVQDRLGDTSDHKTPPGDTPQTTGDGPFQYANGDRPLAGYVIKRGVGTGGFGEVYYAVSDAGKEVALKLIRRNLDTELRGMRQCLNLKHPHLLSLFDIREDDSGNAWIVMEYISGKSLEAELADHPRGLPAEAALAWFRGIAAGVACLHDHGIVHRDLKPGNIFCDEGIVKVGDYGLSKFITCSRRSGHTESIGTVHYMAPEVAHGRYGKELDVYALGAILFELLTGRVPFDGESVGEILMKHLTAQPDVSQLAEPFRGIVARALEKDPARRFATVGEMLAALPAAGQSPGTVPVFTPVKTGLSPSAPPPSAPPSAPPPLPPPQPAILLDAPTPGPEGEEPIARAVRQQVLRMRQAWRTSSLPGWAKVLIVVGCIFTLLAFSRVLIPLGVAVMMLYVGYRMVRWLYRVVTVPPAASEAPPVARRERRPHQASEAEAPVPVFVVKPSLQRAAELVGSLLVAAAVTAAMCIVVGLIAPFHQTTLQPEHFAWLFLVGLVSAWTILIVSKFWEGTQGEPLLRRFVLMTLGLALGAAAFGLAETLLVRMPVDPRSLIHVGRPLQETFYPEGRPSAMACMAVFAALFALLRWWRQADPMRTVRLSLVSLLASIVAAAVVAGVLQFPQPWLTMIAACVSVSVQIASPWVPDYARLRPQRKTMI